MPSQDPVALECRDLCAREACINCRTQMNEPFKSETPRWGSGGRSEDVSPDRPFL